MAKKKSQAQLREEQRAEQEANRDRKARSQKKPRKQKKPRQPQHERVRAKDVTLTGLVVNRTPIIKVVICHPSGASQAIAVEAVLDTGCTGIAVSEDLSNKLSLPIIETRMAHTASSGQGGEPTPVALANLELHGHEGRVVRIQPVEVMIMKNMLNPMLLGMDILRRGELTMDGRQWKIVFKGLPPPPTTPTTYAPHEPRQ